eukprot:14269418-Heterocapsa_arctica.AAC.1
MLGRRERGVNVREAVRRCTGQVVRDRSMHVHLEGHRVQRRPGCLVDASEGYLRAVRGIVVQHTEH